ncbi:MAG: SAM-dependent chlorinase/fluorinase [Candidatus Omnitrophota bacterium]
MKTIALLTDFGLSGNFAGVMKGVILKINSRLRLVDITHQVTAHDIAAAAFLLKGSYKYFPKGTIFLVVVDPGVGSKRRPIIIRSKNYLFVGPDNGALEPAACADGIREIVAIENKSYFLKPLSGTFHGRDIFAPVAAYLSKGKKPNVFGRPLNSLKQSGIPSPEVSKDILKGEVVYIDRFGNLVTNIDEALFKRFRRNSNRRFKIKIKDTKINSLAGSYEAVRPGKPLAIFGSFGLLEISVNKDSAEKHFRAKRGLAVKILL